MTNDLRDPLAYAKQSVRPFVPAWAVEDAAQHVLESILSRGEEISRESIFEQRRRAWSEWKRMESPVTGARSPQTLPSISPVSLDEELDSPTEGNSPATETDLPLSPALQTALMTLTEKERAAVNLHILNGMSLADTASELGTTRQWVSNTTARARKRLHSHLTNPSPLRTCNTCGLEARTEDDLPLFEKQPGRNYGRKNLCKPCGRVALKKRRASRGR